MEVDWSGPPRRRYFKWRANARAGREGDGSAGAFNGQCAIWEGDTFFMELRPIERHGKLVMPAPPTWADPLEEYEPPAAPRRLTPVAPTPLPRPDVIEPTPPSAGGGPPAEPIAVPVTAIDPSEIAWPKGKGGKVRGPVPANAE